MPIRPQAPGLLVDALRQAALAEPRRPAPVTREAGRPADHGDIVSRRDESGVKHPGDFPNPASTAYRGCF